MFMVLHWFFLLELRGIGSLELARFLVSSCSPLLPLLFESSTWWYGQFLRFTILKMEYYPFNIRFYELKLNRTGNTIKHRSTLPPSPVGVDSFCWTSSKISVECLHEVEARLSDDVAQGTSFFSDDYTSGTAFVESWWIFGNSLDWRVKHLMVLPVLLSFSS